jgi:hypothetical protein
VIATARPNFRRDSTDTTTDVTAVSMFSTCPADSRLNYSLASGGRFVSNALYATLQRLIPWRTAPPLANISRPFLMRLDALRGSAMGCEQLTIEA